MMRKQKPSFCERLNIGDEVRELKLGCTFNNTNTTNAFHTIKYDFKPASVDKNRVATVDVGPNNEVTVTAPNLVSSCVPNTTYKGNQKKYTKECILIFDKRTGEITLEKLSHNIQVKNTREMTNKPSVPTSVEIPSVSTSVIMSATSVATTDQTGSAPILEHSTVRKSSKTKIPTGNRRNTIIELETHNSPMHGSSSTGVGHHNKSPQSPPIAWNANTNQATLPSIPMIVDDDDSIFGIGGGGSIGDAGTDGGGSGVSSGVENISISPTLASAAAALERNITSDLNLSSSTSISESSGSERKDDRPAINQLNQLPDLDIIPMTAYSPQMQYQQQTTTNYLHNNNLQLTSGTISSGGGGGNFMVNDSFPNDLLQNDLQLSSNSSDEDQHS